MCHVQSDDPQAKADSHEATDLETEGFLITS